MKKLTVLLLIALVGTAVHLYAQGKFWNSKDAYLGQIPPGDHPEVFASDLVAKADTFAMDRVAFSNDGKEFYYPTNNDWFSTVNAKIRYFKYDGKKWIGPLILNERYYAPTFSIDNKTLYFLGGRPDSLHAQVWQSSRTADGWTEPVIYLKKEYGLYDFMPTKSGRCYVGSNAHEGNRKDFKTYDFCTLVFTQTDTLIQSLGPVINTPGFDGDFYVAPDESYMILSYKEKPDYECELGITFRKKDGSWTPVQNLGSHINEGDAHRWGEYVTPDGKYLFYSRGTSPKDCHVYWVRFDRLLNQLRQQAFKKNSS